MAPTRKRPRAEAEKQEEKEPPLKRALTEPDSQAGSIYVCGQTDSGQLGLGNLLEIDEDSTGEIYWPKKSALPDGAGKVLQIAAGGMHSVALTVEGKVFTTGVNDEAALGRKTDTKIWEGSSGVAGDSYSWGEVEVPQEQGKVVGISAGDSHTVAFTDAGAVWGWGTFRGNSGPFGFLPNLEFALLPTLVFKPSRLQEQVVAISSGADHVLALRRDGSVLSWGFGEQGQLGRIGKRTSDSARVMLTPAAVPLHNIKGRTSKRKFAVAAIRAGSFASFLVSTAGEVAACGVNASGQLGLAIQGGTVEENVILVPKIVSGFNGGIKDIGPGKAHTLALKSDNEVLSFGLQTYGRLGRNDADPRADSALAAGPVDGLGGDEIGSIVSGHDTSAVVTTGGKAYLWGMGTNFQLAKGNNDDDSLLPRALNQAKMEGGVSRILQIAFGGQHTLILAQP